MSVLYVWMRPLLKYFRSTFAALVNIFLFHIDQPPHRKLYHAMLKSPPPISPSHSTPTRHPFHQLRNGNTRYEISSVATIAIAFQNFRYFKSAKSGPYHFLTPAFCAWMTTRGMHQPLTSCSNMQRELNLSVWAGSKTRHIFCRAWLLPCATCRLAVSHGPFYCCLLTLAF